MRTCEGRLAALVAVALLTGCGDDDSGGGGTASGFDVDKLLRACVIVHSCDVGYDIGNCVFDFNRRGTPAQVDCVLAASVANCSAANECIGTKRAPDTNCVNRCLDDETFVQCNGLSMHTEITCAKSLQSGGPTCITAGTTAGCGVATCSAPGELTCDGAVSHACGGGIEVVQDCSRVGASCITSSPGCAVPTQGPCTTSFACQGDQLLSCDSTTGAQRFEDCTKVVPGGTCILVDNFVACGWGSECNVSTDADLCIGTTLRTCVLGAIKDINCTSVGGTQCLPNPVSPGAMCSS